ncbi:MAG: glutamate--tRNA ligase [Nanoarchaeota archaeon]|nr:glutamate--tRNA ligase [Nanoarchaeota archaeon]
MGDLKLLRKYTLQNAVFYEGKANLKAVLGKMLANEPAFRKHATELEKELLPVVAEVNALSLEEQRAELEQLAPELLVKEEKQQDELPPLKNAIDGKVVTRFAPAPTGPLHLPHVLRAAMLSMLYAKKYNGTFIVRLEDTDPKKVEAPFYEWIQEDLKNAGMTWDKLYIESDDMPLYYEYAEKLLSQDVAYVCTCLQEQFQEFKKRKQSCPCRNNGPDKQLERWEYMRSGKYQEGRAVVRLKIGMDRPNPAIRDPALLRIAQANHPRRKDKVWPLYNFANVIEDHTQGVTHVFRGKEHQHNTEIQEFVYKELGWMPPTVVNFGMIILTTKDPTTKQAKDVVLHTRDMKKGIAEGAFDAWDDIRLPTVRAYLRRGYQPETFRRFALTCGLSKTDIRIDHENLDALNRQELDPAADRFMVVIDPVKLQMDEVLKKAGIKKTVRVKVHPEKETYRDVVVSGTIFITKDDFERLENKHVRLIDLCNVRLEKKPIYTEDQDFDARTKKIQWVAEKHVKVTIVTPDGEHHGIGELALKKLPVGTVIQMLRIGFGRIDSKTNDSVTIWWAHK